MSFRIISTGSYVPEKIVTNDDLAGMVDTSDEWITQRVGVKKRHIATSETTSDLAYKAAEKALKNGGTSPGEIDMIICATITAEYKAPNLACMVQKQIGASCPAMDINSACSSFIFALDTAAGFFSRGKAKKILIIGAERISGILDWSDRGTCIIFGDGAGAALLGEGENFLSAKLFTKGDNEIIRIPNFAGSSPFYTGVSETPYIRMKGQETFKFAVNAMCRDLREAAAEAGIKESEIDWVVPHQANNRIIEFAKKKLDIPGERFCRNIENYGNTSSASIAIMLDELNQSGKLKRGDIVALCAFGGGLSSAACILKW